jgi:hypothetical protein
MNESRLPGGKCGNQSHNGANRCPEKLSLYQLGRIQMSFDQYVGLGFLILGMIGISSHIESLSGLRLPLFHRELKPMRERWGVYPGTLIHILGYVVAPTGFGLFFLMGVGVP